MIVVSCVCLAIFARAIRNRSPSMLHNSLATQTTLIFSLARYPIFRNEFVSGFESDDFFVDVVHPVRERESILNVLG